MLSKTRGEEDGIKTVTLARGTFNGLSPPGPASVAGGRGSERSNMPRTASPDARDKGDPLRLLGSVGIVELLEQDTRPTFIVDIGDAANYAPESLATLQILFANSALRSSASTWALVAGTPPDYTPDETMVLAANQFRHWLLSTVIQGGSLETNISPVEHGGVIWSCYTLRKRLRVVSGAVPTHVVASITPASGPHEFSIPSTSSPGMISGNSILVSPNAPPREPQDYFGTACASVVEDSPSSPFAAVHGNGDNSGTQISKDVSGIFPTSASTNYPSVENGSSPNNECVLRAETAGDVDPFLRDPTSPKENDMGFFDWTRLPLTPSLPRHIQFARSVDWSTTHLGPIEYWSNDLRAMCNLIM
jgi:hypothetical protein